MKKFICTVCGYIHEGDAAPEKCPLCKAPASKFNEMVETEGGLEFADQHVIGVAKGCDEEMIKDLNNHFMGECTEVGMYLAMSRQADREGYPEVAEAFKRYAGQSRGIKTGSGAERYAAGYRRSPREPRSGTGGQTVS